MRFIIIGRDGTDAEAPVRRQAVRPTHLEGIQPLVDAGNILMGGSILDDAGTMVGSIIMADFPSREELDAWLDHDPYVTGGVWQQVEVAPFRVAIGSWMPDAG
jgi:uncharacterized protein YciI